MNSYSQIISLTAKEQVLARDIPVEIPYVYRDRCVPRRPCRKVAVCHKAHVWVDRTNGVKEALIVMCVVCMAAILR